MRASILLTSAALCLSNVSATITYTLWKADNPSDDQLDAYNNIESAMNAAISRWTRLAPEVDKYLNVYYEPGVPTAEGNQNGDLRFGSNRSYQREWAALHEMGHCLGVGQSGGFFANCDANNWPNATPLVQSFDGPDARVNCGGGHFWPYGLNYESEYSDIAAERNVLMIQAMKKDGM